MTENLPTHCPICQTKLENIMINDEYRCSNTKTHSFSTYYVVTSLLRGMNFNAVFKFEFRGEKEYLFKYYTFGSAESYYKGDGYFYLLYDISKTIRNIAVKKNMPFSSIVDLNHLATIAQSSFDSLLFL